MKSSFCTCPITQCSRHQMNHNEGCTPCIKDNLEKGKMSACIFRTVSDDVSEANDWTMKGFVEFYYK